MRNYVVKGKYQDRNVIDDVDGLIIIGDEENCDIVINSETIKYYEVVESTIEKSNVAKRGFWGAVLLGPIGAIGGAMTTHNSITIKVEFNNGDKSLIQMDEKIFNKVKFLLEKL